MKRRIALATLSALLAGSVANAKDDYVYGPAPDWTRYRQLGEAAVRAALPDQANWQIGWPNGYVKTGWRKERGYTTCGVLRATGPVEGHNPLTDFVVVIDRDAVKTVDIANRSAGNFVTIVCRSAVQNGQMPPASMMNSSAAPTGPTSESDMTIATLGLVIRPVTEGAYVISAAPGSAAAKAGLIPGTVITRVNGIALAGLGDASAQMLSADTPTLALDTAAGRHIVIPKP